MRSDEGTIDTPSQEAQPLHSTTLRGNPLTSKSDRVADLFPSAGGFEHAEFDPDVDRWASEWLQERPGGDRTRENPWDTWVSQGSSS